MWGGWARERALRVEDSGARAHSPLRVALVVGPMLLGTSSSWYCSPARVLYTTLYS